MPDELVRELLVPPPLLGVRDSLDPALRDEEYSPEQAPVLINARVRQGKIETRPGMAASWPLPAVGPVRLFGNYYPVGGTDAGKRIRVLVQNGQFYYLREGADVTYQTASGGSGLGTSDNYYSWLQENDRLYFLDRVGTLRRFESSPSSGNQVRAVAQPVAPAAAPTFRTRTYKWLTKWDAAEVAAWTETSNGNFDIALSTTTDPAPGPYGGSASLTNTTLNGKGQRVTRLASGALLESQQIAFFIKGDQPRPFVSFDLGQATVADYSTPLGPTLTDSWQAFFVDTSPLSTPYYISFKDIRSKVTGENLFVSDLLLPGKLDGFYRWVYTHYDPATGRESQPSAITNSGFPVDLTGQAQGVSNNSKGLARSCALMGVSDSGTDSSTTKMRFYRNGGVPSLTKDDRGRDVWYRVATVSDLTALSDGVATVAVGDVSIKMASNPSIAGFAVGDWIVIDKGNVGSEDFVKITGLTATNIQFTGMPALYAHGTGVTVQVICMDNTANSEIDTTTPIDLARNDPPTGAQWIARNPQGRLVLGGLLAAPTKVFFSNLATPDRPDDYEVFPTGIDPQTTRSPTQGFTFEVGGDVTDEKIMWAGYFRDTLHLLTKTNLYRIRSNSQLDWGPTSVQQVAGTGCLSGDTVAQVDGALYWVSPGPRVVRWGGAIISAYGGQTGEVTVVSDDRVRAALTGAPTATWNLWFARSHARRDGNYYLLYLTPTGQTANTLRLDYNQEHNIWEENSWQTPGGSLIQWQGAATRVGGTGTDDTQELSQAANSSGLTYLMEIGSLDNGAPIQLSYVSKSFDMGAVSLMKDWFCYLDGVTDTVTLTISTFGSEYGSKSATYSINLAATGQEEQWQRLDRTLKGRWIKVSITGSVSNRPAIRVQRLRYLPLRERRVVL